MTLQANPLATRIAHDIAEAVSLGRIRPGAHLSAQRLADEFGVSRSPVREAMKLLESRGLLRQESKRGYFVAPLTAGRDFTWEQQPEAPPDLYRAMAEDWLNDRIPAEVNELLLRERYNATKAQVTNMLMRAAREGWVERRPGYGWNLLPVAKTTEAFEQIYRFRMTIEPAAMLEATYRTDPAKLAELKAVQVSLIEGGIARLPAERLLESGARFHEELVRFSGNPFFHQALVRVNRMRRLLEYRAPVDHERLLQQCGDHLVIIDRLERGEVVEASYLMRQHLSGALERKSPIAAWRRPAGGRTGEAAGAISAPGP